MLSFALAALSLFPCLQAEDSKETATDLATLERWTAEILPEIEELRGASFLGPVAVKLADEEEFHAYARARLEEDTTPEELEAQSTVAKLLGLISADTDVFATMSEMLESQVGGFYDPGEDTFYLMEKVGGDGARVVLSHELTHALDDQLHDIDGGLAERKSNADAQHAFHAVVEGSGQATSNAWMFPRMGKLDLADHAAMAEESMQAMEGVPAYFWKSLLASYMGGEAFLKRSDKLFAVQLKPAAVEDVTRAFLDPPRSTEQILHPEKYWDEAKLDEPVPVALSTEDVPDAWSVLFENTMGEVGWGLVVEPLARRKAPDGPMALLGMRFTYPASEGWGGDRYLLLGRDGARVLWCETVWDDEDEAAEFAAAVEGLAGHLDAAADALARHREVEGSGHDVHLEGARVRLRIWIGVEAAEVEGLGVTRLTDAPPPPPEEASGAPARVDR